MPLSNLIAPLAALGLVLIAWAIGRLVMKRWPVGGESWLEEAVIAQALGLMVLSALAALLAWWQLYTVAVLQGVYAALLIAALVCKGKGMAQQFGAGIIGLSDHDWSPLERAFLPPVGLFMLLVGFYALAPSTTWDPLDYHYEMPRLWLQYGGFYPIDTLVYAKFPAATEVLFGWLMAVESDLAANQFTIYTLLLVCLAMVMIGVRYFSRLGAVGGLAIFLGLPLIYTEQAQGGVIDCALTFYMLLALWAGARYLETKASRHLLLAAAFVGAAVATKHSGWMMGFFLIGMFLWSQRGDKKGSSGWLEAAIVGGVAFLMGFPWYLRSLMETGNPVWPFGEEILHGSPKGYADILYWSNPNFTREMTDLFTWWWEATTRTELTQYRFRLLTPVYLGLMPAVAALMARPGPHRIFLAFAALQTLTLLYAAPGEPRYMLTSWAILAMGIVSGMESAGWLRLRWAQSLAAVAILGPLTVTLAMLQIDSRDRLPFVLGEDSRAESYARRVETWPAIAYVEEHIQPGEVVIHGDPRVYLYSEGVDYRILYPFDYPGLPSWEPYGLGYSKRSPTTMRVLQGWHQMNVRYLTLSAGAHYMGLTRATLLKAQFGKQVSAGGVWGVRSYFDGLPPELCRGNGESWETCEPLPESPLGPLSARTIELGSFTSPELALRENPRAHPRQAEPDDIVDRTPGRRPPNYSLDMPRLQQRWTDADVLMILRIEELIERGHLTRVLDNPACPVFEVSYPAEWGGPGSELSPAPTPEPSAGPR